ncbi:MAG: peptide-methionine (S)-S-oxide reductase MsrA, partial [Planctomycetales bacterium]|nr:peptide-methionine (S)-S-oxide reductase MsrA [Planctomycetales bacterium]
MGPAMKNTSKWTHDLLTFGTTIVALACVAISGRYLMSDTNEHHAEMPPAAAKVALETATFGSGCFWCTEAVFERLDGVSRVVSGYAGGEVENPTYEQVCSGATGHAEVVQISYDPAMISYAELLEVFWKTHDPTTLNRQGADMGTQYRSVVFFHNEQQREEAEHYKKKLDESGAFASKIVTEIAPMGEFYAAEAYHQNYYAQNPYQGYCAMVIAPKVDKFKKAFADKLRKSD